MNDLRLRGHTPTAAVAECAEIQSADPGSKRSVPEMRRFLTATTMLLSICWNPMSATGQGDCSPLLPPDAHFRSKSFEEWNALWIVGAPGRVAPGDYSPGDKNQQACSRLRIARLVGEF